MFWLKSKVHHSGEGMGWGLGEPQIVLHLKAGISVCMLLLGSPYLSGS